MSYWRTIKAFFACCHRHGTSPLCVLWQLVLDLAADDNADEERYREIVREWFARRFTDYERDTETAYLPRPGPRIPKGLEGIADEFGH
jgi:hypothetical protein